jgi:two-component system, NarL family, nitrate/nitrite response regulator NarL
MRLVLCDDNRILCEALGVALEARGHQVLSAATTSVLGIAAVAKHQPDVCLLDLRFPHPPDGLGAARIIRERYPGTAVLLLSGLIDPAVRGEAMRIGVAGFLRKDQNVDHVADALDVVASGGVIFDSMATVRPGLKERRRASPWYVLTPREQDVLRRMVAGQNTTQMSREMNIEVSTLRTYVKNVLAKLGVHSRLQAAALATREHLLDDWTAQPSA